MTQALSWLRVNVTLCCFSARMSFLTRCCNAARSPFSLLGNSTQTVVLLFVLTPRQVVQFVRQQKGQAVQSITMAGLLVNASVSKSSQVRLVLFFTKHSLMICTSTDQYVIPGNIIVRQRGTLFHPAQHVRLALSSVYVNPC